MESNPYKAPESDLATPDNLEIPKEITKKIKGGWIAAIISGVMTLVVILVVLYTNTQNSLFNIWNSLDVVFIFLMAYGIYRKSRVAATVMFIYFLISKIMIFAESGKPNGLLLTIIFLYYFFQAMVGTFQYHKLMKGANA